MVGLFILGSLITVFPACSSKDDDPGVVTASGGSTSASGGTTGSSGGATSSSGGSTTASGGMEAGNSACVDEFYATAEEAGLSSGIGAYDYADKKASCITMTAADGKLCAKGTAAEIVNMDYEGIWGAGVGITVGDMTAAYDASGMDGFSFTIDNVPTGLRVGVMMQGDTNNYFTTDVVAGENTVLFADLANGSWVMPAGTLDTSKLMDVQFQVPSVAGADTDFEFCVSDIDIGGAGGAGGAGGE